MAAGSQLEFLEPPSREALHDWLTVNHATSPGVWLAIGKKGNRVTTLTYEDAVLEALIFGWIDSTVNRVDADRYKILYVPRKKGSTWSPSNKKRVADLMEEGLIEPAGLAVIERAKADGTWMMLDDVEHLIAPQDLLDALASAGAREGYESLSASMKKQVLWWIVSAKRPETRSKRIAETVSAAEKGVSPLSPAG